MRPVADQTRAKILADPQLSPTGMIEQMMPAMTRTTAMRPMLLQNALDSNKQTVANAFHELIVTDLRPELGRITVPMTVLFVIPANAPMTPEQFESGMRAFYAGHRMRAW